MYFKEKTDLEDLKARLTAASGPDRELDARIGYLLVAKPCGPLSHDEAKHYIWPEDDPSWSFAMALEKQPSKYFISEKREVRAIEVAEIEFQREDGKWVLLNTRRLKNYTASLDASIALTEAVLPGCWWSVSNAPSGFSATLYRGDRVVTLGDGLCAHKGSPAIALILATVNALIEREKKDHD